jgi:hypothetical protein
MFIFACLSTVYSSLIALTLRGAYSLDVFGAIIFASFSWISSWYLSYYIDVKVFGLIFQERFEDWKQNKCGNCD